jgi:hypothetical protein
MLQLTGTKHPRPAPVYLDGYATVWAKHMLNTRAREVTSIGMSMGPWERVCAHHVCLVRSYNVLRGSQKIFLKKPGTPLKKRYKKSFYHIYVDRNQVRLSAKCLCDILHHQDTPSPS